MLTSQDCGGKQQDDGAPAALPAREEMEIGGRRGGGGGGGRRDGRFFFWTHIGDGNEGEKPCCVPTLGPALGGGTHSFGRWRATVQKLKCVGPGHTIWEVSGYSPVYLRLFKPPPFNSKEILSLLKFFCFSYGSIKRLFLCFAILYFTIVFLSEPCVFHISPFFHFYDLKGS